MKTLGRHEVKIKLHADVSVDIPFDVVSENPIVEAPAAAPAPERRGDERNFGDRRPDRYSEPRRFTERNPSGRKTDTRK